MPSRLDTISHYNAAPQQPSPAAAPAPAARRHGRLWQALRHGLARGRSLAKRLLHCGCAKGASPATGRRPTPAKKGGFVHKIRALFQHRHATTHGDTRFQALQSRAVGQLGPLDDHYRAIADHYCAQDDARVSLAPPPHLISHLRDLAVALDHGMVSAAAIKEELAQRGVAPQAIALATHLINAALANKVGVVARIIGLYSPAYELAQEITDLQQYLAAPPADDDQGHGPAARMLGTLSQQDNQAQQDFLQQVRRRHLMAHGIEDAKGGIINMIDIMIGGKLQGNGQQPPYIGSLSDGPADLHAGPHGPNYIVFRNSHPKLLNDLSIPAHQHKAYIVPTDERKQLIVEALDLAVTKQMLSAAAAQELKDKLYTYDEFTAA